MNPWAQAQRYEEAFLVFLDALATPSAPLTLRLVVALCYVGVDQAGTLTGSFPAQVLGCVGVTAEDVLAAGRHRVLTDCAGTATLCYDHDRDAMVIELHPGRFHRGRPRLTREGEEARMKVLLGDMFGNK